MKITPQERVYWKVAIPSMAFAVITDVAMLVRDSFMHPVLNQHYAIITIAKLFGVIFTIAISFPALVTGFYAGDRIRRRPLFFPRRPPRIFQGRGAYILGFAYGIIGIILIWFGLSY